MAPHQHPASAGKIFFLTPEGRIWFKCVHALCLWLAGDVWRSSRPRHASDRASKRWSYQPLWKASSAASAIAAVLTAPRQAWRHHGYKVSRDTRSGERNSCEIQRSWRVDLISADQTVTGVNVKTSCSIVRGRKHLQSGSNNIFFWNIRVGQDKCHLPTTLLMSTN